MSKKSLKVDDIKIRARDRWHEILPSLAPELTQAVESIGRHVPCPVHGGKDGFRMLPSGGNNQGYMDGYGVCNTCLEFKSNGGDNEKPLDGFGLLMWINQWDFRTALERVNEFLCSHSQAAKPAPKQGQASRDDYSKAQKRAYAQLSSASPKASQAHINYFNSRGIGKAVNFSSGSILFSNGIFYKKGLKTPAIIAKLTNADGEMLGLHKTYLTQDGRKLTELEDGEKATCKQFSKTKETISGGAIRFGHEKAKIMAVGEGLETMLAIRLLYSEKAPAKMVLFAATCTANMLESIEIPEHIEKLIIFADKDKSERGIRAAQVLHERERYEREVVISLPKMPIPDGAKGVDWLDYYVATKNGWTG